MEQFLSDEEKQEISKIIDSIDLSKVDHEPYSGKENDSLINLWESEIKGEFRKKLGL